MTILIYYFRKLERCASFPSLLHHMRYEAVRVAADDGRIEFGWNPFQQ